MKPTKLLLPRWANPILLCTQVPQLIHDLVIHSVLLILGRLAPFPGGSYLQAASSAVFPYTFIVLFQTTCTHFTTLFLSCSDP